jgi:hypothetical protein
MPGLGREISPSIKRPEIRQQKTIQWPASSSGENLNSIQINLINIGPFFAVYFDIDKVSVHEISYLFIHE